MPKAITRLSRTRVTPIAQATQEDDILVEEPLEIRALGEPLAITMRTPGEDHRLVLGFLWSEGLISSANDLLRIAHCGRIGEEGYGNVIDVQPVSGVVLSLEGVQRGTLTTASCGVCGRSSIEDLRARCSPVPASSPIVRDVLWNSMEQLSSVQQHFAKTGGSHAAAAFSREGHLLCGFEDVGRHNAVDKVLGELLLRPQEAAILAVSGRASFEIVQKAATAKIPIILSVSAVSSLAISLAEALNITLLGFVRKGSANIYTHPERILDATKDESSCLF